MTVIKRDFGKESRLKRRRFRRLLSLNALHEENIQANPLPYLERASERIFQLERALFEAIQAATRAVEAPSERIEIGRVEYEGLLACKAIVEAALKELQSDDNIEDQET